MAKLPVIWRQSLPSTLSSGQQMVRMEGTENSLELLALTVAAALDLVSHLDEESITKLLGCPFKGGSYIFRQGLQGWTTRIREDEQKPLQPDVEPDCWQDRMLCKASASRVLCCLHNTFSLELVPVSSADLWAQVRDRPAVLSPRISHFLSPKKP